MASQKAKQALKKARQIHGKPATVEPPRPPAVVLSRESIAAGFRVSVRIPNDAQMCAGGVDGKLYLLKKYAVKGGRFCVHIYGDDLEQLRGKTIQAALVIERKTFEGGGTEVYANAFEVDDVETSRMVVYPKTTEYEKREGDTTFDAFGGIVVISPLTEEGRQAA